MALVWIPSLLRAITGGQENIAVAGNTIGSLIEELERRFPGIRARLCDGNGLRAGMTAAVDGQIARLGIREPVKENSEVHFLPAIGGGTECCTWNLNPRPMP